MESYCSSCFLFMIITVGFIRHFNNGLNLCFYIQRQTSTFMVQEEEEDDDLTFTQPSTSQVQRGLEKLSATQVDQKVTTTQKSTRRVTEWIIQNVIIFNGLSVLQTAEVVQYFLVKDQKKIPIRRAGTIWYSMRKNTHWEQHIFFQSCSHCTACFYVETGIFLI